MEERKRPPRLRDGGDRRCPRPAHSGRHGCRQTRQLRRQHHALYRGEPEDWVGRGAGVDDCGFARKVAAVERAVDVTPATIPWNFCAVSAGARSRRSPARSWPRDATHPGHPRRLRGLRRGGNFYPPPTRMRSAIASPAMSLPRARTRKSCAASARRPSSILECRLGEASGGALAAGF